VRLSIILVVLVGVSLFGVKLNRIRLSDLLFLLLAFILLLNDLRDHVLQFEHVLGDLVLLLLGASLHFLLELCHLHHVQFDKLLRLLLNKLIH
jgi:hypothetical protein